jgi:hypothetical protein
MRSASGRPPASTASDARDANVSLFTIRGIGLTTGLQQKAANVIESKPQRCGRTCSTNEIGARIPHTVCSRGLPCMSLLRCSGVVFDKRRDFSKDLIGTSSMGFPVLSIAVSIVLFRAAPAGPPYPPSSVIEKMIWAPADTIVRRAAGSDNFPAKWMSEDGLEVHLVFSGDDSFSVRKATIVLVSND